MDEKKLRKNVFILIILELFKSPEARNYLQANPPSQPGTRSQVLSLASVGPAQPQLPPAAFLCCGCLFFLNLHLSVSALKIYCTPTIKKGSFGETGPSSVVQ